MKHVALILFSLLFTSSTWASQASTLDIRLGQEFCTVRIMKSAHGDMNEISCLPNGKIDPRPTTLKKITPDNVHKEILFIVQGMKRSGFRFMGCWDALHTEPCIFEYDKNLKADRKELCTVRILPSAHGDMKEKYCWPSKELEIVPTSQDKISDENIQEEVLDIVQDMKTKGYRFLGCWDAFHREACIFEEEK